MARKKENAVILSQEMIAQDIYSMWIKTDAAKDAAPGQFISMYTNDGSRLLPRPISICEINKEEGSLRVVYRVTGKNTGTELFSRMKAGETIPVIGPLGNGFPYEKASGKKVFLMGGGDRRATYTGAGEADELREETDHNGIQKFGDISQKRV